MAVAMADTDMAAVAHISDRDTSPTDSTEKLQDLLILFKVIQLLPSMTFPLLAY